MPTCIYCRRTDPPCGFNVEHVIPQALGTFETGDPITLTREVCVDCNQYFGDHLELFLNRDSAEAMFRFRYGLKDPAQVGKMFPRRVRFRLPLDGTKWGGAYLDLIPPPAGEREPYVTLAPQFACERRDGRGWVYFSEEDVAERSEEVKRRIKSECSGVGVVWTTNHVDQERMLALVAEKGIPFNGDRAREMTELVPHFADGHVRAKVEFRFDKILARAIAKIGFNYFAKTHGAAVALRPEVDAVRRFVRDGEGRFRDFVQFGPAPVLHNFQGSALPPRGHLVTVGWDTDGKDILARVCPFQHMTYLVRLAKDYAGVWQPIESAHLYDLQLRRAARLAAAVRIEVPGAPPRE